MKDHTDNRNRLIDRLRFESIAAIPTALVSVATAVTFIQVFDTWDFLWPLVSTASIVHIWGVLVRSWPAPVLVSLVSPTVSVVFAIGWLRFSDTLWFGLPLSATWQAMASDLRSAWDLVGDVVTPVEFTAGFGTMAMFVIGFVAAVSDSFAARYGGRVEVFVPSAATLFIVATVGTGRDRLELATTWLMIALFATVLIRRNRGHETPSGRNAITAPRSASARSIIGVVTFIALVGILARTLAPILPGAGEEAWLTQRAQGESRELKPLVDIRRQLNDPSDTVLFTVLADAPSYWRVTGLANFDGATWTISESRLDAAGGTLSPPVGIEDAGVDSLSNFQRFTLDALTGNLVPVAATPTRLRSSTQSLFYEPESGTLLMGGNGARPRDSYEMESTMLSPRPERLLRATSDFPPDEIHLSVPDDDSMTQLREIATAIAPASLSPYERALALQDFFRSQFTYSLDAPALDDSDATLEFLERRTGYCEHFASTFALFARLLGLSARVAIGFTPGERSLTDSGDAVFTVRTSHAHAWPEVWFDGIGWVLFEPTPGRGAPNSTHTNVPEEQAESSAPTTTVPTSTTTTVPTNSPSTTPSVAPDIDVSVPDRGQANGSTLWLIVVPVALALVVLWSVLPRVMRAAVRRRNDLPVLRAWRQATALYEFERGAFPASLSPRELAREATSRLYDDDEFIVELARITEGSLYGQRILSDDESRLLDERVRNYLFERRRRLSWFQRVRARLDPVAMWRLEGGTAARGRK